jgi:multicomponent Na+:H+ antiporter subunit B
VLDLILLLIFMVAAGIVAVEIRDLLSSAIALGAVGFAVAIGFIRLAAPDLAIVQVVIEVISVVFFVAIMLKTTHVDTTLGRKYLGGDIFSFVVFGLFALVFVYFGVQMLLELSVLAPIARPLGPASAHYVQNAVKGMTETGSANVVTSVVLDYRGFDTLGEATVLFTSVIGVISLLRIEGRKK